MVTAIVIVALIAALSACGLAATWALLRPLELARDAVFPDDELDAVSFGFDSRGFG